MKNRSKIIQFFITHSPLLLLIILGLIIMWAKGYTPYFGEFFYPNSLIGLDGHSLNLGALFFKPAVNNLLGTPVDSFLYNYSLPYVVTALLPKLLYGIGFNFFGVVRIEFISLIVLTYILIYSLFTKLLPQKNRFLLVFLTVLLSTTSLIWVDDIYRWNNYLSVGIIPLSIILLSLEEKQCTLIKKIFKYVIIFILLSIATTNLPLLFWIILGVLIFFAYLRSRPDFKFKINTSYLFYTVAAILIIYFYPLLISLLTNQVATSGTASWGSYIMPVFKSYPDLIKNIIPLSFGIENLPIILLLAIYCVYFIFSKKIKLNIWIIILLFLPIILELLSTLVAGKSFSNPLLNTLLIPLYQPWRKAGLLLLLGSIAIVISLISLYAIKIKPYIFILSSWVLVIIFLIYSPLFNYKELKDIPLKNQQEGIAKFKQAINYINTQYPNKNVILFPFQGRMREISSGLPGDNLLFQDGEISRAINGKVLFSSPSYLSAAETENKIFKINSFKDLQKNVNDLNINNALIFKGPYSSYFNNLYSDTFAIKFPSDGYHDINDSLAIYEFKDDKIDLNLNNLANNNDYGLNLKNLKYSEELKQLIPVDKKEDGIIEFHPMNSKYGGIVVNARTLYAENYVKIEGEDKNGHWASINEIKSFSSIDEQSKEMFIPLNTFSSIRISISSKNGPTPWESAIRNLKLLKIVYKSEDLKLSETKQNSRIKLISNQGISYNSDSKTLSPTELQKESVMEYEVVDPNISSIDILSYAGFDNNLVEITKTSSQSPDITEKILGRADGKEVKLSSFDIKIGDRIKITQKSNGPKRYETGIKLIRLWFNQADEDYYQAMGYFKK